MYSCFPHVSKATADPVPHLNNDQLDTGAIQQALDELAARCPSVAAALAAVGYPSERRQEAGFGALVRIAVGQQVSTKAAAAIATRLEAALGGSVTPDAIASTDDASLRGAGLSAQKLSYLRALTEAVESGQLPLDALPALTDADAIARITAVKGFGVWSAHMYLMFSLGRPDIWPVGDLAIRAGFGRLLGLTERPTPKQTDVLAEPYRPYRSALALLCWKFYSEAPL